MIHNNKYFIDFMDRFDFPAEAKECFDLLGEIIGTTYKEELVDEIFANFCLGK